MSFEHIPEDELRAAFGPVIDRLADNGIDLTKRPIEVAPIAHYHMGGIRVDARMETCIAGLFAAGEAVGGANGANRLSGNAIPEAFVFGERAGRHAARAAPGGWRAADAADAVERLRAVRTRTPAGGTGAARTGEMWRARQELMWDDVGILRTAAGLTNALARIRAMRTDALDAIGHHGNGRFDMEVQDVLELRAALLTAETVALAALARRESRGAHQREDLPDADPALERNQVVRLDGDGNPTTDWEAVVRAGYDLAPVEAQL